MSKKKRAKKHGQQQPVDVEKIPQTMLFNSINALALPKQATLSPDMNLILIPTYLQQLLDRNIYLSYRHNGKTINEIFADKFSSLTKECAEEKQKLLPQNTKSNEDKNEHESDKENEIESEDENENDKVVQCLDDYCAKLEEIKKSIDDYSLSVDSKRKKIFNDWINNSSMVNGDEKDKKTSFFGWDFENFKRRDVEQLFQKITKPVKTSGEHKALAYFLGNVIQNRDFEQADYLIEQLGVDVEGDGPHGENPIYIAARAGNLVFLQKITGKVTANSFKEGIFHRTPLHAAVSVNENCLEVIKWLLQCEKFQAMSSRGINSLDYNGGTVLHGAAFLGCSQQIISQLFILGVDANIKDRNGKTALDIANEKAGEVNSSFETSWGACARAIKSAMTNNNGSEKKANSNSNSMFDNGFNMFGSVSTSTSSYSSQNSQSSSMDTKSSFVFK